jgi:hypothetical protein
MFNSKSLETFLNLSFDPSDRKDLELPKTFANSANFVVSELVLAGLDGAGGRDKSTYFKKEDLTLPCQDKVFKAFFEKVLQVYADKNSDQKDDIIFLPELWLSDG